MSSRQTYGCLGALAEAAGWLFGMLKAIGEEFWSAVVIEAWDRWQRRRGGP